MSTPRPRGVPYRYPRVINQAGRRAPRSSPHTPVNNSAALVETAPRFTHHAVLPGCQDMGRVEIGPCRAAEGLVSDGRGRIFEMEPDLMEDVGFWRTRTAPLRIGRSCPLDGYQAMFERERCAEATNEYSR